MLFCGSIKISCLISLDSAFHFVSSCVTDLPRKPHIHSTYRAFLCQARTLFKVWNLQNLELHQNIRWRYSAKLIPVRTEKHLEAIRMSPELPIPHNRSSARLVSGLGCGSHDVIQGPSSGGPPPHSDAIRSSPGLTGSRLALQKHGNNGNIHDVCSESGLWWSSNQVSRYASFLVRESFVLHLAVRSRLCRTEKSDYVVKGVAVFP